MMPKVRVSTKVGAPEGRKSAVLDWKSVIKKALREN